MSNKALVSYFFDSNGIKYNMNSRFVRNVIEQG
ncbi:hypothetical protein LASUN_10930 [Lentilactobacillus sunkii]|jgi:hypothetical protein|uniref:Uncharacterized protein n=1 Tax=Lentilactobacillus sunkii TaxID=481719 RepID=A0A1E7XD44_9LACO|nr:hypothetical protein LASUN_10930 [Lentilactobacillus sunkii]